ncbi:outer membrane efflux protein [Fimbriimonas ginsengisoli Gsoil 348]|uniref:Outer membrane efflux protein n=2 Tax=Fimbriimonas ginsengisoli TaxID=1005039 RepID=A0A068NL51_FIMGI|nr:outer membrane efflux protein [Fimbriimonas ginsengisoli Gsoil 348]
MLPLSIFVAVSSALGGQQPTVPQTQTPPIQPNIAPVPLPPAVVLPGPPSAGGAALQRPLTADEAARIALRLQPSLGIARADILAAQGRTQVARSGLNPQFTANAGYTRVENIRSSGSSGGGGGSNGGSNGGSSGGTSGGSSGFTSNVSVNQLLFDFNRTRNAVRQAEALERATTIRLTVTQNDLVFNVKNAFYTFVQNSRLVTVQEANVAARQAQLALAQARLDAGIGAPADVVTATTNLGAAAQSLTQARQTALTSQIALDLAMGVDARTPITPAIAEEPAPNASDVNALIDTALQSRPEIRQIQETLRAANYGVSVARADNSPSVGVSLGIGARGPSDPLATTNATLGINLTWNFGDGGRTSGLIKQARADVLTAQSNLLVTSQTVVRDVAQAYTDLRTAEQRAIIAASQVANATEAVRLAEGRFRAGLTTFIDVTTAQAALVDAQTTSINAEAAVQQARAALRRAVGGG